MNYPVRKVYITQEWGVNPSTYASLGLKGHNGIDLRIFDNNGVKAVSGDLIAPHDGKIIEAGNDPDGYGIYYKIENDIEGSILGHNKQLLYKVGDSVKEGQLIGCTDNTGWSTGSHVHWGYYRKPRNKADGYSGTCDPRPYIKPNTGSQPESTNMTHEQFYTKFLESFRKYKDTLEWGDDKFKFEAEGLKDDAMIGRMIDNIARDKVNKAQELKDCQNKPPQIVEKIVEKEVVKEVPVEVIKEVNVVDMSKYEDNGVKIEEQISPSMKKITNYARKA